MKEKPILMSGPMVRAILEGCKTQTRRIVKTPDGSDPHVGKDGRVWKPAKIDYSGFIECPYGQPGDRLWVKETWGFRGLCWSSDRPEIEQEFIHYRADDKKVEIEKPNGFWKTDKAKLPKQRPRRQGESELDYNDYLTVYWRQWRPSIFMPRWASRITLEVTAVRVERLQDISEEDAKAEGCNADSWDYPVSLTPNTSAYRTLWESINGPGSWSANPWVWVVSFNRITP